jgi:hypothetical protein
MSYQTIVTREEKIDMKEEKIDMIEEKIDMKEHNFRLEKLRESARAKIFDLEIQILELQKERKSLIDHASKIENLEHKILHMEARNTRLCDLNDILRQENEYLKGVCIMFPTTISRY